MYVVSIITYGMSLNYSFKGFKSADDLFRKASKADGRIEIEDDYGSRGSVDVTGASINFTDISKDLDRNGEQQILQAKASLKTKKQADSDIGLRMMQNSAKLTQ